MINHKKYRVKSIQFFSAIHILEKRQLVTCPGFPGYCSEAYPGGVCTVVCAFGRPNVPECQVSSKTIFLQCQNPTSRQKFNQLNLVWLKKKKILKCWKLHNLLCFHLRTKLI